MTLVIGEIGINHDGDYKLAKKLIDIISESGAWGVKFQYRNIDNYFKNRTSKQKEIGKEIIDHEIKRNYLSPKKIIKLAEYSKKKNLKWVLVIFRAMTIRILKNTLLIFTRYLLQSQMTLS